jgi:DNA polymerase
MDPRSELDQLIIQVAERLRFYEEQGITDLTRRQTPVQVPPPEPSAPKVGALVSKDLLGGAAESSETLEQIRSDLGDCRRCKLWKTRTNVVFGEGNPRAELMFVGEAPGADEDATGRPFVGRAGKLLDKMIEAIGMKREQVYIANVVKSRPPKTANLKGRSGCLQPVFLARLRSSDPADRHSWQSRHAELLETRAGISRLRGNLQDYPESTDQVLPTFHPAYLLRSPDKKRRPGKT